MKVAVVLMPYYRRESPAAELGMIIGLLKNKGHEVLIFDVNNDIFRKYFKARIYWKNLHLEPDPLSDEKFFLENEVIFKYFATEILKCSPDVIVFYSYGNTEANSKKMAYLLKQKEKSIPIVFTGMLHRNEEEKKHLELNQDKFPEDFIIVGYDEVALPELISAITDDKRISQRFDEKFKRSGKIIDCSDGPFLEDFDFLPFFDFTDFDLNLYKCPNRLEIFTSRSCIWRCKFCTDWKIQGKYRSMSARRIFNEFINQSMLHKGINHIRLVDLEINSDIKELEEFCDLMIEAKKEGMRDIYWSGDAIIHPGMIKEVFTKMREAGCVGIGYGLESGSDSVIKAIGKLFPISVAEEVIRNTHEANIKSSINIITGFPSETRGDFQKTVDFIKKNRDYIDEIRLTFTGCRIRKESDLSKGLKEFDIVSDSQDLWKTKDEQNTYEERLERFKQIAELALSLKLELRLGGRILRKA